MIDCFRFFLNRDENIWCRGGRVLGIVLGYENI